MKRSLMAKRTRLWRAGASAALLSVSLSGCNIVTEDMTAAVPNDYRQRHPIAVTEADRSIVVFVGHGRAGLSAAQRADVIGLARAWVREGTGAIVADVPVDTVNSRVAATTYREISSLLASSGVPARAITLNRYTPDDPRTLATIRLSYPRIAAVAGPCGLWPEDLGPSIHDYGYNQNKPYHNFGCATQRNLAAMVENPADLEQPRPETPAYTPRRNAAFEKYRKGESTTTTYPEADKAKLSDTGK